MGFYMSKGTQTHVAVRRKPIFDHLSCFYMYQDKKERIFRSEKQGVFATLNPKVQNLKPKAKTPSQVSFFIAPILDCALYSFLACEPSQIRPQEVDPSLCLQTPLTCF